MGGRRKRGGSCEMSGTGPDVKMMLKLLDSDDFGVEVENRSLLRKLSFSKQNP